MMKLRSFNLNERLQLILIGAFVGLCGGLASVLLNRSLIVVSTWLKPSRNHYYGILIPAFGALLSCVFLRYVIREGEGHGVPEVIYSISRRGGLLRMRSSFSRLVSCLLTIASGGSAGPESPIVISGSSIGSNVASFFRLKDRQRIVIVGCGAAAAIASIFNAPVAGIAFTLEAILGEWTLIYFIPIAIASVVGTEVSRLFQGNQIPFENQIVSVSGFDLTACMGLALFSALYSVMFLRTLRHLSAIFKRFISYPWIRAAIGGLIVGLIGFFIPYVLGDGYEITRTVIEGKFYPGLILVLFVIIAKIFATSLTIGSGGSGGLFAPCLVIGSFVGIFYQRMIALALPDISWAGESYYALLGMAGLLSSVLQAPMTGIFLITEITGGYQVLLSVVLVAVLSASLSHFYEPFSVYHQELIVRGELVRPRTDKRVLSELNVFELLERDCYVVHPEMRLKDLVSVVQKTHRNYFPVEDSKTGDFLGMIHLDDIRSYLFNAHMYNYILVEELMDTQVTCVSPYDELSKIFELFDRTKSWSLPVVYEKKFLGLISKATILDHYRRELMVEEET